MKTDQGLHRKIQEKAAKDFSEMYICVIMSEFLMNDIHFLPNIIQYWGDFCENTSINKDIDSISATN